MVLYPVDMFPSFFFREKFLFTSFLEHSTSGPPTPILVSSHLWGLLNFEDSTGSLIQTLPVWSSCWCPCPAALKHQLASEIHKALLKHAFLDHTPRIFDLLCLRRGSEIISVHQASTPGDADKAEQGSHSKNYILGRPVNIHTSVSLIPGNSPMKRLNNEERNQK